MDSTNLKKTLRAYFLNCDVNKLNNLDEIDKNPE